MDYVRLAIAGAEKNTSERSGYWGVQLSSIARSDVVKPGIWSSRVGGRCHVLIS